MTVVTPRAGRTAGILRADATTRTIAGGPFMSSSRFRRQIRMLSAGLVLGAAAFAVGQQPPAEVPTLPPVRVEGTPPTAVDFVPEDTGLTGTILDGTIFSNPPTFGYRAETSST